MISKSEVQVIDDKLLLESILIEKKESEADSVRSSSDSSLVELSPGVTQISLSFKRIGRIENLVGFDSLVKLCLDNNLLEEICNLSHLVHLRWLDLSFNKIRKIQGLENLINLEDLTLYSNKIQIVEGLSKCTKLQCLSLGRNLIDSLDQIKLIRQIKSLRMLTLSGNPVSEEPEYEMMMLAYVDTLKYLDYTLIDEGRKALAKEQYHDELLDVEEKEAVSNERESREKSLRENLKVLDEAGILFSHTLFDDMFAEDADVERLKYLPGIRELIETFRNQFKSLSDETIKSCLERHERKRRSIAEFERAVKAVRDKDSAESTQLIENFLRTKKSVVIALTDPSSPSFVGSLSSGPSSSDIQRNVRELNQMLEAVCDELMSIEVRQVQKFEGLVDEFDTAMQEFKQQALEAQGQFFRGVEDLEERFSGNMRAVATDLIDRLTREELAEDYLSDEAMALVVDKDSCMGILSASHDLHLGRILKRQDEAAQSEKRRTDEMIQSYLSGERTRNRDRVLQIHDFYETSKAKVFALSAIDEDEGEDEK